MRSPTAPARIIGDPDSEVGHLYTRTGEDVYQLIQYTDRPTVRLKNLETGELISLVIGSPLANEWVRLAPLEPLKEPPASSPLQTL